MYSNGESAKTNLEEKRESFRVQIRRSAIDAMLKKRRGLILEHLEAQGLTHQDREALVRNCSLALTGFPSDQWLEPLNSLSCNLSSFQGNFEPLLQSNMVYNICQVFKPEYSQLGWRSEVAQLLLDMICLNQAPGFVVRLIDYGILRNICQILADSEKQTPRTQCSNYLYLLGNIAGDSSKARNAAIQSGAIPVLNQLLNQAVDEGDIELLTWVVSNFMKPDDQEQRTGKHCNVTSVFIPIFEKFIQCNHPNILTNVLHSVVFLLSGKQYLVSNVYHCTAIRQRLIELVESTDKAVRILAMKTVGLMCSTKNQCFVINLLRDDLLDRLQKSITTFEQSQREKLVFLWVCENIIKNSDEDLDELIHHACINKLFEYAHPTEQATVRSQALTVLRIMLQFATYNQVEYLYRMRSDFLEMLVHNLTVSEQPDVIVKSLKSLTALVKMYKNIGSPPTCNKMLYELERFCHIENIVDALANHQNKLVEKAALALANLIAQYQLSDL